MKRTLPLLITAISGFVLIVAFFIPVLQMAGEAIAVWFDILASIAFVLGGGNLLKLQLQKISDRHAGWGYAAVTLVTFIATLLFGMFKLGSPPEPSTEFYGESFAFLPVDVLPTYTVSGTIPVRTDDALLPASAREQLREEDGQLAFRGWITPGQVDDLMEYDDTLEWRCAVERLGAAAVPPAELAGKVKYRFEQQALAWTGTATPPQEAALRQILKDDPPVRAALDEMFAEARKRTSIAVTGVPSGFSIPEAEQSTVTLNDGQLTIVGPMGAGLRENLAKAWSHFPPARPLTAAQQDQLVTRLEEAGPALNTEQLEAFHNFMVTEWKAEQMVAAINTAGVPLPVKRPICEVMNDLRNDIAPPASESPAPVELNAAQVALIEAFVANPGITPEQLPDQLAAAGPLTDRQRGSIAAFFAELPTQADRYRELAMTLLQRGPLSREQQAMLFTPAREQFQWRQEVGRLFVAAHVVKYPWSGDYSAQGTPFWWLYLYIFQPLLTTTFALLAFYVASAAFRAFRAKNLEATLLLGTAFIILLGRTFAGTLLTGWLPNSLSMFRIDQLTMYIMSIFNTAGNRAIMIGIALGIASTSLRVLLGIDRSYLGSSDD